VSPGFGNEILGESIRTNRAGFPEGKICPTGGNPMSAMPLLNLDRPRRLRPAPLPDVALHQEPLRARGRIDRVGMEKIELPVRLRGEGGELLSVPAEADVFVSLDSADAKGIHMSRLFLSLQETLGARELTPAALAALLGSFVDSHAGISQSGHVRIRCSYLVQRDALASGHRGWKSYPLEIAATLAGGSLRLELGLEVVYSSTCPCSAALSRELIARDFRRAFAGRAAPVHAVAEWLRSDEGLPATPHSQRSFAELQIVLDPSADAIPILRVIDAVERGLGTPVQAAVKREDEQAFAELNGSNLMFCEDAARIVKRTLDAEAQVHDFRAKIRHEESLHAHDAVAVITKGVPGGLTA
jgi:GTP cyclohydrolase I